MGRGVGHRKDTYKFDLGLGLRLKGCLHYEGLLSRERGFENLDKVVI